MIAAPDPEGTPARPLRRTRTRLRRPPRYRESAAPQADTRAKAVPAHKGTPARPRRRTSGRRRRPTPRVPQCGPSGGHAREGGTAPEGTSAASQEDTRGDGGARPRGRQHDPSGGRARDGGGRPRGRGPSGGHACDGGARPRGSASASLHVDTRATAVLETDDRRRGSSQDTRIGGARPRWRVGAASQAYTPATMEPIPECAPTRPLSRTRARRRRLTPTVRQSEPSGGHAREAANAHQRTSIIAIQITPNYTKPHQINPF